MKNYQRISLKYEKEERGYFLRKLLIDDKEIRALNCKL